MFAHPLPIDRFRFHVLEQSLDLGNGSSYRVIMHNMPYVNPARVLPGRNRASGLDFKPDSNQESFRIRPDSNREPRFPARKQYFVTGRFVTWVRYDVTINVLYITQ